MCSAWQRRQSLASSPRRISYMLRQSRFARWRWTRELRSASTGHKASRRDLETVRYATWSPSEDAYIPPKLPDTTNLVFTRSKNEYREMRAMAEIVREENRRPPLKKLMRMIDQRTAIGNAARLTLSPKTKRQFRRMISRAMKKGWARGPG